MWLIQTDTIGYPGDLVYPEVAVQPCGFPRSVQAHSGLLEEEKERLGETFAATVLASDQCERYESQFGISSPRESRISE